jgi:hypothetical protein
MKTPADDIAAGFIRAGRGRKAKSRVFSSPSQDGEKFLLTPFDELRPMVAA